MKCTCACIACMSPACHRANIAVTRSAARYLLEGRTSTEIVFMTISVCALLASQSRPLTHLHFALTRNLLHDTAMGVKGLQTFLKENRQSLCRTLVLDRDGAAARPRVPVVVDAWGWVHDDTYADSSIIYQLYLDSLPWTAGGEYLRFYLIARELVEGWRSVGLEPTFVFDGE